MFIAKFYHATDPSNNITRYFREMKNAVNWVNAFTNGEAEWEIQTDDFSRGEWWDEDFDLILIDPIIPEEDK